MKTWFDYLVDSIVNLFAHFVLDIREIFWDLFFLLVQKFLRLTVWIQGYAVGLLPDFDPASYWASVPADIISMLHYLQFGKCLSIIIGAVAVRSILNVVPFIRI